MKKIIVISAINLRSGGTLSILNDCLKYLDESYLNEYRIIALIHNRKLLVETKNIEYIEFPKSIKSYFYRLYYEYVFFNKFSKKIKPHLWLSLHDISPRVKSKIQAVYCHNTSPFYKVTIKETLLDFKFTLFSIFYKYLYRININKNNFVIVQQDWIRKEFYEIYNIKKCIVSYPILDIKYPLNLNKNNKGNKVKFFYPSLPRIFKNFEIICEAVQYLNDLNISNYEVILTLDGSENKYSKLLYKKYKNVDNIKFIGLQSREMVFELYAEVDCLIFPSKLESWGLPISEFKIFNKPMFLADLEYSHETVGNYEKVEFFNAYNHIQLANYMQRFIKNELFTKNHNVVIPEEPFSKNWEELFKILLK